MNQLKEAKIEIKNKKIEIKHLKMDLQDILNPDFGKIYIKKMNQD